MLDQEGRRPGHHAVIDDRLQRSDRGQQDHRRAAGDDGVGRPVGELQRLQPVEQDIGAESRDDPLQRIAGQGQPADLERDRIFGAQAVRPVGSAAGPRAMMSSEAGQVDHPDPRRRARPREARPDRRAAGSRRACGRWRGTDADRGAARCRRRRRAPARAATTGARPAAGRASAATMNAACQPLSPSGAPMPPGQLASQLSATVPPIHRAAPRPSATAIAIAAGDHAAPLLREAVGEQRHAGGLRARLADADAEPRDREQAEAVGEAGQRRHHRPAEDREARAIWSAPSRRRAGRAAARRPRRRARRRCRRAAPFPRRRRRDRRGYAAPGSPAPAGRAGSSPGR